MALTDIKIRTAKPTDKQYKLTDPNISRLTMQKSVWVIFSVYV